MLNQRKYLSKFSSALVIAGSIVGLSATELYAADTVMPKANISQTQNNIAALLPGSMLSLQRESIPTSYQHAGQRYVITYRSRGVNGEPIVISGYILLLKDKHLNKAGPYWHGHMARLVWLIHVLHQVIMQVGLCIVCKKSLMVHSTVG